MKQPDLPFIFQVLQHLLQVVLILRVDLRHPRPCPQIRAEQTPRWQNRDEDVQIRNESKFRKVNFIRYPLDNKRQIKKTKKYNSIEIFDLICR